MNPPPEHEILKRESLQQLQLLVDEGGSKNVADCIGVTVRQLNRILSGASPNPIERLILCLNAAPADVGDRTLDYICQEMGGHFVRHESLNEATVNAVKECAEAIAAISDGHISRIDVQEVREAISALSGLILSIQNQSSNDADDK